MASKENVKRCVISSVITSVSIVCILGFVSYVGIFLSDNLALGIFGMFITVLAVLRTIGNNLYRWQNQEVCQWCRE